jgi:sulfite reductase (ferredoxin)
MLVGGAEGFQVHLGGGLGLDAGFGRKLRGLKVASAELTAYVEHLVRAFAAQRQPGERFAQWVARADEETLAGASGRPAPEPVPA